MAYEDMADLVHEATENFWTEAYGYIAASATHKSRKPKVRVENIPENVIKASDETVSNAFHKQTTKLYNNPLFSDLRLTIEDTNLHCHQVILAAASTKFRELIEAALDQRKNSPPPTATASAFDSSTNGVLELRLDVEDSRLMRAIVKYIYTGNIEINSDDLQPLLVLSAEFGVEALKEECGFHISREITHDNVFYLLDFVEKFGCERLRLACAEFLAKNFTELHAGGMLFTVELDTFAALLASPSLSVTREEEVYRAALTYADQYAGGDPARRRAALARLLPSVRLALLPGTVFAEIEADRELIALPEIHALLHEAYRLKAVPEARKGHPMCKPRLLSYATDDTFGTVGVGIALSNERRTVTQTTGANTVATTPGDGHSTGRCVWRLRVDSAGMVAIGVARAITNYNMDFGGNAGSVAYYNTGLVVKANAVARVGGRRRGHAAVRLNTGHSFMAGDVITVLLNCEESTVTFRKNEEEVTTQSIDAGRYKLAVTLGLGSVVTLLTEADQ